jgi:hypothetical protein
MRSLGLAVIVGGLAISLACGGGAPPAPAVPAGPSVDPATAGTITAAITFEGTAPVPEKVRLDGDAKCVTANGASDRPSESIVLGDNSALQNVFVYIKDGLGNYTYPLPTEPVLLDQQKCWYTPRVLGVRVGQPVAIRNSDSLMHNVATHSTINTPFNMAEPLKDVSFNRTFATKEVMVPVRCDVHAWMNAWIGVLDHPYFGTTGASGQVDLTKVPPGTYTIEAWHETLGTKTAQVTLGAKESKDVSITFVR